MLIKSETFGASECFAQFVIQTYSRTVKKYDISFWTVLELVENLPTKKQRMRTQVDETGSQTTSRCNKKWLL